MAAVFYYNPKKTNTKQSQVYDESKSISTRSFETLESESELINTDIFEYIDNIKLGHMVPLSCGHNGTFNFTEYEYYRYHLRNAGFIDL